MADNRSRDAEREQLAALLRKIIVDDEFRYAFEADPRSAIAVSGVPLSSTLIEKIVADVGVVPSVLAHMDGVEDVSKFVAYYGRILQRD